MSHLCANGNSEDAALWLIDLFMEEIVFLFAGGANASDRAADEHSNSDCYQDSWQKVA